MKKGDNSAIVRIENEKRSERRCSENQEWRKKRMTLYWEQRMKKEENSAVVRMENKQKRELHYGKNRERRREWHCSENEE